MADLFNLDFDEAKADFKTFLESHDDFSDYNFEGSTINNLLDVFAYFTQTFSFYLNNVANEMFIATATQDDNVYKLANMLNYLPRRKVAPSITLTIARKAGVTDNIHIPKYSAWSMGSVNLTNLTDIDITTSNPQTITLYEGVMTTEIFTSDGSDFQTYDLVEREDLDNTNLFVYVDVPDGLGGFTLGTENWKTINLMDLNTSGNNYYIDYFSKMSIKFDNGQVFNKPSNGDRIRIIYLNTNGVTNNGGSGTTTLDEVINNAKVDITNPLVSVLVNGLDEESITAIKTRASGFFSSQGNAVVQSDYNSLLVNYDLYDTYEGGNVWSGHLESLDGSGKIIETSSIKDLGHVYISTIKDDYVYLTQTEINLLITYFNNKKFNTIFMRHMHPVIVDVSPTISVKYASTVTANFESNLITTINTQLRTMEGYDKTFNKSNLDKYVDEQDNVDYMSSTIRTYMDVKSGAEISAGIVTTHTGSPTFTILDTGLADLYDDDYFKGYFLHSTSGTNSPSTAYVVDYAGDTGTFTYAIELLLADASSFSVGSWISGDSVGGNDGLGTVQHVAGNTVYINLTSGTFVASNGVDNNNPFVGSETTITTDNTTNAFANASSYTAIYLDEHKVVRLNQAVASASINTTLYTPSSSTSYTATGGSTTTLIDTTNLQGKFKDDYWAGFTLKHLTGSNAPQTLAVTNFDDSTGTLTFATALAINSTDTYRLEAAFTDSAGVIKIGTKSIGTINYTTGFIEYDYNFNSSNIYVEFDYDDFVIGSITYDGTTTFTLDRETMLRLVDVTSIEAM